MLWGAREGGPPRPALAGAEEAPLDPEPPPDPLPPLDPGDRAAVSPTTLCTPPASVAVAPCAALRDASWTADVTARTGAEVLGAGAGHLGASDTSGAGAGAGEELTLTGGEGETSAFTVVVGVGDGGVEGPQPPPRG